VKKVDEHLVRLRKFEQNTEAAKPIGGNRKAEYRYRHDAPSWPWPGNFGQAQYRSQARCLPAWLAVLRWSRGNRWEAMKHAQSAYWHHQTPEVAMLLENDVAMLLRTPVAEGTTFGATYAAPLVVAQNMASEFAAVLRPATIVGRIQGLRRVPFNISLPRATAGTSVNWVGESAPKPVTSMAFDTVTLRWSKAAAIIVLTEELVRFSNPSAEAVVRADLIGAMAISIGSQWIRQSPLSPTYHRHPSPMVLRRSCRLAPRHRRSMPTSRLLRYVPGRQSANHWRVLDHDSEPHWRSASCRIPLGRYVSSSIER
jgi:hypothetical protein